MCTGLRTVNFPTTLTTIDGIAFLSTSLGTVSLPDSVKYIGGRAFQGISALRISHWPDSLETIATDAFSSSGIETLFNASSIKNIGAKAFYDCKNLGKVGNSKTDIITILSEASNLKSVGDLAFGNCSYLEGEFYGTINSVTLSGSPFTGSSVTFAKILDWTNKTTVDNNEFSGVTTLKDKLGNTIQDLVIPSGVTSIGDSAFAGCDSLQTVSIPQSVTSIGEGAFSSCTNLTSLTLATGIGITSIPKNFCYMNGKLTTTNIPEGVQSIGADAYFKSAISSITVPYTVLTLEKEAFYSCEKLESIVFQTKTVNGVLKGIETIGAGSLAHCKKLSTISFPATVKMFSGHMENCIKLKSVYFYCDVTSLPGWMFSGAVDLEEVHFENQSSLISLSHRCFANCSKLDMDTIPWNYIRSIDYWAFRNCTSFSGTIRLRSDCVVDELAFVGCSESLIITK